MNTNYTSQFPHWFLGYLGCGSIDDVFRDCPQRANPDIKQKFFKDFWAHVPSPRKTISFANPPVTPTSNINVLSTQTKPPYQSSIKKPRLNAIFACVNNLASSSQKHVNSN